MEVWISDHDGCAGRIASTFMSPAPITRRDSCQKGVAGSIASTFMSPAPITRRDSCQKGVAGSIASTFMSPAPITRRDLAPQQRVGPAGGLSVADVELANPAAGCRPAAWRSAEPT